MATPMPPSVCAKAFRKRSRCLKLGLPPKLRRFFATTYSIENLIGTLRHVTRNIKRWCDRDMQRRWVGLGRSAPEGFRRIKRHGELRALAAATASVRAA
jgi:hypothetical protein